jgi:hypothetical protein
MYSEFTLDPPSMLLDHNETISSGDPEFQHADPRYAEQFGEPGRLVHAIRVMRPGNQPPMNFVLRREQGPQGRVHYEIMLDVTAK